MTTNGRIRNHRCILQAARRQTWPFAIRFLFRLVAVSFILPPSILHAQGALTPSGPPAPSMKTLDQIQPRIPLKASDLPLELNFAGYSYYLTENIIFSAANTNGITINGGDVTIDLNGYILGGPGAAEGNQGSGIVCGSSATNVTIMNGILRSWRVSGCNLSQGSNARLIGLNAYANGDRGLVVGDGSLVENCSAHDNKSGIGTGDFCSVYYCTANNNVTGDGISTESACSVTGCATGGNYVGVFAGDYNSVTNCSAMDNSLYGIYIGYGSSAANCASGLNGNYGFYTGDGACVTNCTAQGNTTGFYISSASILSNCSSRQNTGNGILVTIYCRIVGNVSAVNGGAGFMIGGGSNTIEENAAFTNTAQGFQFTGNGNLVIKNSATGNSVGFNLNGAQRVGAIITGSGTISADPWANFDF